LQTGLDVTICGEMEIHNFPCKQTIMIQADNELPVDNVQHWMREVLRATQQKSEPRILNIDNAY